MQKKKLAKKKVEYRGLSYRDATVIVGMMQAMEERLNGKLEQLFGDTHRIETVLQEIQVSLDEQEEKKDEDDSDEEDDEKDEGEWVIRFYSCADVDRVGDPFFRGLLDGAEDDDNEVWDNDVRKAVVYASKRAAAVACQGLNGPLGDEGDINVEALPSKHRKKGKKGK